jgi:hypothetical protein
MTSLQVVHWVTLCWPNLFPLGTNPDEMASHDRTNASLVVVASVGICVGAVFEHPH